MDTISIANWAEYQHYGKRNPPWIKLHNKLLDNYDYACLQDASKLLLISLYLLASRTDNKIPHDIDWIRGKALIKGKVDLRPLLDAGFVLYNKDMLAGCKQDAINPLAICLCKTETETETEKRKEIYKEKFGQFQNVTLSEGELAKLKEHLGEEETKIKIEALSEYISSKGKKYKSHYATILSWARKEGKYGRHGSSARPRSAFLYPMEGETDT